MSLKTQSFKMKLTTCLIILTLSSVNGFNWFWSKPSEESTVVFANGVPLVSIPYESMTDDEKFLQEASKITDIQLSSPLETCQHKVVMKIRTSCSAMTEEDLAKLSVNLLNCQSTVEGRKIYPCTEEMSLKQCTTDMDADMWNAYHLMSNRARAVCYSARSTQFRALTELTVNKLMQSSQSQIKAFDILKENQDRLEMKTTEALTLLTAGNRALLEQQQHLKDAQASAHNLVTNNLRELYNEKALIRSGHLLLSTMTEDIKNRLDRASQQLLSQSSESQENHRELLEDLVNIQKQAELIWEKIESSTEKIVKQNSEAAEQFEETLEKLEKINNTIHYIWNVTESMRIEIDEKLGWITDYIGDTGEQLQRVYRVCLHIVYLLAAMIVASFLNAPFLTRVTILSLIPANLVAFLKHGKNACLDFTSITVLIFLITGMYFIMTGIQRLFSSGRNLRQKEIKTSDDFNYGVNNGHSTPRLLTPEPEAEQLATPRQSIRIQVVQGFNEIVSLVANKLRRLKDNTMKIVQTAASWCRQNTSPVEELSCSYQPTRKTRDDLVHFGREYPSLSEDGTDHETSRTFDRFDRFNLDDAIDAQDLRRRLYTRNSPASSRATTSRSVTPGGGVRIICSAKTKNGSQCKSRAQVGRYYCGRHNEGSSIVDD